MREREREREGKIYPDWLQSVTKPSRPTSGLETQNFMAGAFAVRIKK